jgi:hypothetical protein
LIVAVQHGNPFACALRDAAIFGTAGLPLLPPSIQRTLESLMASIIPLVPSLEPSSQTRTSSGACVWFKALRIVSPMVSAAFHAAMITDTRLS